MLKIEIMKIGDVVPYENNAKEHPKEQVEQIADSITEFGFNDPIAIDSNNIIIEGHGRLLAAEHLKMTEVPIIRLGHLSDVQRRAYILAHNKLTMNSGFDVDMLAAEMQALDELDFDLELTGFSFDEIDELDLLGEHEEEKEEGAEDFVPAVAEVPVIKLGDLIELGNHRVLCGDSTSEADVEKLMGGGMADMVITDPPYNINFKPQRNTYDKIMNDSMSNEDFEKFLDGVFKMCKLALNKDTYIISFMGWSTIPSFNKVISKYFSIKSMPIWKKNNFGIGYYTRPQYEPFYLCLNGNPIKPKKAPSDVFEFAKVHNTIHSCEKPTELLEYLADIFNKNGLFYEPFGGSGSMLIACENTNRVCNSMELDPKYAEVICERWVQYTGVQDIKINGREVIWDEYKEQNRVKV